MRAILAAARKTAERPCGVVARVELGNAAPRRGFPSVTDGSKKQQESEDGMNSAQYFVVQSGNEWKIRFRNELFGPYRSRDEALLFAIDAAKEIGRRESGAKVLVEDVKDGFLTRWTYGERPHLPAA